MNDYEAIEAIRAVLDRWFRGDVIDTSALTQISHIIGHNKIQHEEDK